MDTTKLTVLINELRMTNRYFEKYFASYEISNENVMELYKRLPIINKAEIERNLRNYISDDFMPELDNYDLLNMFQDVSNISWNHDRNFISNDLEWRIETTTGTTGKPFSVLKSRYEKLVESKYLLNCRKKIYPNINLGNGFLLLEPIDNYLKECYRKIDFDSQLKIVNHLNAGKYCWIIASALQFRKLYKCIMENGYSESISKLPVKLIETTSQSLDEEEKKEMAKVFPKAQFCSQYGCREVWNIAYECKCGRLHLNNDYLKVDVVDEHGNIIHDDDQVGEVIITSYLHRSMPFFKYYLGDRGRIKHGLCQCGSNVPWIELQKGRIKQKIVGTKYYGNEVFRKILRYINFHHSEIRVEKIKIMQVNDYALKVYALVNQEGRSIFEKIFIENCYYIIKGFGKFDVEFIYDYPFKEDSHALKQEIFENYL